MTLNRRTFLTRAAGAAVPGVAPLVARAADYPDHPIRWIVAYPAGGGSDFLARQLAPAMGKLLGTTLVVGVLSHIVLIVYGYALTAQSGVVDQGWTILTTCWITLPRTRCCTMRAIAGTGWPTPFRLRTSVCAARPSTISSSSTPRRAVRPA